jgi:NTP pyrophosphatase (non-canonical NTP hydrolase)
MGSDEITTIDELKGTVSEFVAERDWDRFHRPKDVAIALSIESSELLDLYLWDRAPDRKRLEEELGDILFFLVDMSIREDIDLVDAFRKKMELNNKKYPADLVKGRDDKYTEYREGGD